MAVVAWPDHISALNLRLRSFNEITVLAGAADGYTDDARTVDRAKPRISPVKQSFWKLPHYAILMRRAGGPAPDRSVRIRNSRVDLWFYGPGKDDGTQEREAYRLCRTVLPALMPGPGETDAFVAANCRVYGIQSEAEPIPFVDTEGGHRIVIAPIVIAWSEVPVS